jgi:hypothetical protein
VNVGNGNRALFWSDRWIARQSISGIAPEVLAAVNLRALKTRKVATALPGNASIQDISGALSADGVIPYTWSICLKPSNSVQTTMMRWSGTYLLLENTLPNLLTELSSKEL